MKKVIVVGLGEKFVDFYSKRFPFGCFDIIGVTDFGIFEVQNAKLINGMYVEIEKIKDLQIKADIVLITGSNYDEYYNKLVREYGIDAKKIMSLKEQEGFVVDKNYQYHEMEYSFGNDNENEVFYIIRPTYAIGLFACVGRVLAEYDYATRKNWIPMVDMQNYPNMYLSRENYYRKNAWEFFFEQLSDYSLQEVYSSKHVILGDVRNARGAETWRNGDDKYKHTLWEKVIHLNKECNEMLQNEKERVVGGKKGKILGCLLRGTDYVNLQPDNHHIQPSSADMINVVSEHMKDYDFLYLSTEDKKILNVFKKMFGTRLLYTNQLRYENTGGRHLASIKTNRDEDEIKRGREYLISILLLSQCDSLISSICGGGNVVKMINGGRYENQIMINRGIYGIDNQVNTIFDAKTIVLMGTKENDMFLEAVRKKYDKRTVFINEKEKYLCLSEQKPFVILINDSINEELCNYLIKEKIPYSHIGFVLRNVVDIDILKKMHKYDYIDENLNRINISDGINGNIKVIYHEAINSVINLNDIKVCKNLEIHVYGNRVRIEIDEKTSVYSATIKASTNDQVKIGEKCLIGNNVRIYANDEHYIFENGHCFNDEHKIKVGKHSWIRDEAILLSGSSIGDNSIAEIGTVLRDSIEDSNVLIAGNLGKVIRKGVIWARDEKVADYNLYEQCVDCVTD